MPSGKALPGPLLRFLDTLLNKLAGHGLLPDLTGLLQSGVPGVAPVQLAGTQFWVAGSRWLWRYWRPTPRRDTLSSWWQRFEQALGGADNARSSGQRPGQNREPRHRPARRAGPPRGLQVEGAGAVPRRPRAAA